MLGLFMLIKVSVFSYNKQEPLSAPPFVGKG